ncbi:hypothetical protein GDO78_011284 [Eleutherodactylus coqui]|uniref:Histone-lysine N-methyltransferase n=1 Tax=Eleutherodactylus coqui TaxID=57060 RepID=A0A8J6K8G1_ELECQ|nr:hypothetical protein GDO78_011284 [Eleutherodactylus coqui]
MRRDVAKGSFPPKPCRSCLQEDHFLGFGPDDDFKARSPVKPPADPSTPKKPRGRPRSSLSRSSDASSTPAEHQSPATAKQDLRPAEKVKKPESKPEEKRRGRPPSQGTVKFKLAQEKRDGSEPLKTSREDKPTRRKPSAAFQHAAKIKKLRTVKLSPLKPKFKGEKLQIGRKTAVQIVKRRGRPPSSERFKSAAPGIILRPPQGDKSQRGRKEDSPLPLKDESRVSVRQSPRRIKPVRIIPTSKRTDTTIAKQLLQKAKKGAQKKMELEAAKLQGRKGGTQLKNIRQFIMPVVSTVSSRIIKTPRRFIEDEDYEPPIKIARLESAPNGRFSAASCESSEKSSAASQQSSQATSDESRSSSPSVDTSTESQASEETPAVQDAPECLTEIPLATPQSVPESSGSGVRTRRISNCTRSFTSRQSKKLIAPSSLQQSSASPPPPLLSPPASLQPPSTLSEHSTWVIPPTIPIPTPFLSASRLHEKRRSILREPTFRWTSRLESQYFSSAKYAKEGLIRKPIFDNFRPPPLTAEDVGLASASGFSSVVAPGRLFSPLHAGGRFDVPKRSPILRAPRFTPSEAHSRIFESVTLPSSVGRSGGASSMMGMASRRRKRRVFSPIRSSVSRSPSHSMRTRSRRENGSNVAATLIPQSSTSLAGISVSPLTASALNPSFPFSSTSMTPAPGDSAEKNPKTRKQASTPGEHFSSASNSSPALFPLFPSSPQMDRGRSKSRVSEEALKEREAERCREKEREKENSHDSRKDKRKKGSDPANKKEKSDGEALTPATPMKVLARKRPVMAEPTLATSPPALPAAPVSAKHKISKKGRGVTEKQDLEAGAKSPPTEANVAVPTEPVNPVKPTTTTTISTMLDQANKLLASEKHVASLLRTAKCQLQNIEKSKLRKQEQPKAQGQESDSSETSVRGPRIKHVCRRAAVALGRKRAVFPDDMPTLSALPWEEREKVLSSMGNDDKSSIAGSEDADPPAPPLKPIKQVTRNKTPQEPPVKKGRRSRRCGQCPGCQVPDDCGVCTNCLDKPKFGGRNIKKQCCKMRKCQNLQWMPSKAFLQKQAKAAKRKEKKTKMAEKKEAAAAVKPPLEAVSKTAVAPVTIAPSPVRDEPPLTPPPPPKKSDPPKKVVEEKLEEESQPALTTEVKQPPTVRKITKQLHPQPQQLLECNKCRNSYHPECLGPNYPTKPTKKKRVWICTKCVRCKSCGSTTPGKGWDAQWSHDFSLCHDCAKLFAKGNFCPLCNKCYDDDDYESKMMQCGKCDRWVHSKCESLTDEMYEILSNLPESVAYTCINCTDHHPAEWRLALTSELQASLKYVLTALLNSRTSSHLLRYRQSAKPPDLNPEPEENLPSRSSPEGPDPPVLIQVGKQDEQPPLDLEGVKKKMDLGRYTSVLEMSDDIVRIIQAAMNADGGQPELKKANSMVKSFFTKQMERVFPWFSVKKSRFWEPNKVASNSSMLPNAVLPPSLDHNYAQWQERENSLAVQPQLMKKIIPAPKPKSPGDPESPPPAHPAPQAADPSREENADVLPPPGVEDNRQCALCLKYGDDNANDAGRLLYIGQDEWTHINCALWSAEVFEDDDGSLKNVHMAVIRGKQLRCEYCQKLGATVGCCLTSCTSNYHFMCSRTKNCVFLEDKKVYCQKHRDLIKGEVVSDNNFEVFRRVVVDFEGINLRRKYLNGLEPENIHMMIGSMTVDCLGILNDLSDCEEKLFPVGYQCSRVYWSTTDARKRCVYTCKILECRPPPTETDINSTVHHVENRTIAHRLLREDIQEPGTHRVKPADTAALPSPEPLPLASRTWLPPRLPSVGRVRTHRFSTNQRFPGPRPLPSAGSPVTHEIVTVGDPVLSSGLRSIGSRRHSASSTSPQLPKPRVISASHTEAARLAASQPDMTAVLADHRSANTEPGGPPSNSVNQSNCVPSNGHRIPGTKVDKPLETRRAGSLEGVSKSPKIEKIKSLTPRSSESSTNQLSTKVPAQPQGVSTTDSSTSRAGSVKDCSSVVHGSKSIASHQHQRAIKRENDPNTDAVQAERAPSSEEIQETHLPSGNPGVTVTKERRPKSKSQPLESSKDKHSSKPTTDVEHLSGECRSKVDANGNHLAADTGSVKMQTHSKNVEKSAANTESPASDSSAVSPCKAIKPKMAIDNTSDRKLDQQKMSPHEMTNITKSQESPENTDESAANHQSPNTNSEPQAGNAYPAQDSSVLLQDGSKTQEDGSYKRRYPRRSARARSNMFFGLTPLYGVRSYGEEDLPFCSSTPGKKRGKRSAEGQVDGADDLSSSEEDDVYYYNFSRTVVSAAADDRLGVRSLFREDDRKLHRIPQLDGVDDGTESDASITTTTGKSGHTGKRSSKQNGAEKLVASDEQLEKSHTGKGSKGADAKMESCHPVKQDSLETQLSLDTPRRSHGGADKTLLDTFNTELLKSDSDNNNSDDCGNILPIDIMDFVLKNTPAMQALGESPESSSSELLTLGDGLGLDTNRGKDMGLFEVFSQQLPSSEPVDGTVPSTMSAEESFELPLELPSDLSVLTTRSPSLPSQNHSRLGVIPDSQLSTPNDRSLLSLPTPDTGEKRVTVTEKPVASGEGDSDLLAQSVDRTPERHMTPDRFIAGHLDSEHISSSPCGQVDHAAGEELTRNSSTPNLQVPVSPTVPIQNQKYIPSTSESPGPSQMPNAAIQSTPPHLKSTTEKVVVVNQNMQPLYVLQTLPNGVTQKIQLTSSVPSGAGRMDGDVPVLSSMGAGLTLATTLNPTLTSPFPPAGKGLLPMPHHPHLQPFPATPQAAFLPGLTNQPSGLLIGVQPTTEPQLLVSESGQRSDLGSASNPQTSGMSKKRQISRLHTKKNKKLAPSVAPALRHPPEVVSNMTLINFTAPQLAGSLPNHPSLIDLGSLGSAASHRSIPNIIKRSKSGVMYFDQTPLLPQNLGASNSVGTATSVIGLDHGHLTGQVPAIATGSSVLNVVSMQTTATPPPVSDHVTLTSPGILGPSELGSIGNFLIKTSPQGLGLQDNHVALSSGPGIFSQSPTTATLATTSSICVVPTTQSVGMTLAQSVNDQDCPFPVPHHMNRLLSNRPPILPDFGNSDHRPPTHLLASDSEGKTVNSATSSSTSGPQRVSSSAVQKTKSKGKRQASSADKASRKKHKSSHSGQGASVARQQDKSAAAILAGSIKSKTDGYDKKPPPTANVMEPEKTAGPTPGIADVDPHVKEQSQPELKQEDCKQPEDVGFSSPLMRLLQHEQRRQDSLQGPKPRTGLLFEISSDDGFQISANSIEEAWKSLTDRVQEARSNARLKQLSFAGVNGLRMLGLIHDAVLFLVEQLYGANKCRSYKFRFHRPAGEEEPPINPHGSARAEVHQRRSAFDMFNFLASKHRQPPDYKPNDEEEEEVQLKCVRRATSMDLPMPMRFRHLRKTSKEAVGVYRSPIHGRGLFCKRNIDAGEMVIEYSGNVVRSTLTDKREKYYDGKGIGCYMFRIDDSEVVDATMHGNAARFINHSCEPNCYSRVIPIDGQKHIVIFAMRKIYRGEELTYDYKFPIEDASNKLVCNCGTKKCRKFLN